MTSNDMRDLARQYYIADVGGSVTNLVRKIQLVEGHADCFATGKTRCEEAACRWRKECLPAADEELRIDFFAGRVGEMQK